MKKVLYSRGQLWFVAFIIEPSGEKTNNEVSEQVGHKSGCTVTEAG